MVGVSVRTDSNIVCVCVCVDLSERRPVVTGERCVVSDTLAFSCEPCGTGLPGNASSCHLGWGEY